MNNRQKKIFSRIIVGIIVLALIAGVFAQIIAYL